MVFNFDILLVTDEYFKKQVNRLAQLLCYGINL